MKVYVTTRFKGAENRADIEALCVAVAESGMQDFSFVRDVENYQKIFDDPKELWARSLQEMKKCDALLIDVSDSPTGGRVIETGMAYALNIPVFVIIKEGTPYKDLYNGVANHVITYDQYVDITPKLSQFLESK